MTPESVSRTAQNSHVEALHRATLSLYTDLSFERLLRRIIRAAMDLVNARYAALGIPDGKGGLEKFLSEGLTDEERQRIGHPPEGKGLLGEMLRQGRSIRIPDVRGHPKSVGVPEGHPQMGSFLGVPISAYGRPLGQIYLTDKIGADEFTEADQRLVEMLAAHAAAAIENARLYQHVRRSQNELAQRTEELELMNSMATAASSTMELDQLLEAMLDRAMELFAANSGEVFLRDEATGEFRLTVHRGEAKEAFWEIDRFKLGEGLIGKVALSQKPIWTSQLASEPDCLRRSIVDAGYQTFVCVPLGARQEVLGVLSLAFKGQRPISSREVGLLEAVGAGVGVAVENARLTRQARRIAVLEERERFGMDLHDGIIQSIYAVGLTLDSAQLLTSEDPQEAANRLSSAIEGLNDVIRDLRTYILDLRPSRVPSDNLALALDQLGKEMHANSLISTELQVDPVITDCLVKEISTSFFHIAQEALANIAKHARATRAWVTVRQVDEEVLLQIIDNGRGFDLERTGDRLGHGLSNMRDRARQAGGTFELTTQPGDGTTLTVRVPADAACRQLEGHPESGSSSAA